MIWIRVFSSISPNCLVKILLKLYHVLYMNCLMICLGHYGFFLMKCSVHCVEYMKKS
ncbi:hypothetical protein Hanom_Chr09g00829071 [Helianthus anomalus]